jgi:hypothetical protein
MWPIHTRNENATNSSVLKECGAFLCDNIGIQPPNLEWHGIMFQNLSLSCVHLILARFLCWHCNNYYMCCWVLLIRESYLNHTWVAISLDCITQRSTLFIINYCYFSHAMKLYFYPSNVGHDHIFQMLKIQTRYNIQKAEINHLMSRWWISKLRCLYFLSHFYFIFIKWFTNALCNVAQCFSNDFDFDFLIEIRHLGAKVTKINVWVPFIFSQIFVYFS